MKALARGEDGRSSDRKPYAVLDVETIGLRGELCYWTAMCECSSEVTTGSTAVSLWHHVTQAGARDHRNRDHLWWAHNGGEYDYVYLFPEVLGEAARGARITPVVRTDQLIGLRVSMAKHRTDLRDSFALLPASLRTLAGQLAPAFLKGDIGLSEGVIFDPGNAEHRDYAAGDARSLLAVLTAFRDLLADAYDGALPSWSAASTALRAWQRTLPESARYSRPYVDGAGLARAGYYGGMVHLSSVDWHRDVVTLDVNAMYPAVMRDAGVPDGWSFPVDRYLPGRPGFYLVNVTVPDSTSFTFLPYRDPAGLIAWPTGRFPTVLASVEVEAALARGCRVEVVSGVCWTRLSHPFGEFVDRTEAMRAAGGALGYVAKIMGNSLYGKFGSRPTRDEWQISAERPGPEWWPPADGSIDGLWVRHDRPLRAPYLMPHWAAWVTANARLRLLALVEAIGPGAVIYTDTDSVTAPAGDVARAVAVGRVSIGTAFGEVKVEHRYSRFRALAPKVTEGVEDGIPVLRAKGIPRRQVAAAFDTGLVEWDSPNAALQVLQGAAMMTRRHRRLSSIEGSVAWRADDAGRVRPVRLGNS